MKIYSEENYNITLSCTLEAGEDSQYPLEDIMDQYDVNCTGYLEEIEDGDVVTIIFELEGNSEGEENYENIKAVSGIIGKHVYNKDTDGEIELVIE